MHDTLSSGRALRVLTLIDVHTRECLALEAAQTFRGEDVVRTLAAVGRGRALPTVIQVDNGTEFTSKALDHWAARPSGRSPPTETSTTTNDRTAA